MTIINRTPTDYTVSAASGQKLVTVTSRARGSRPAAFATFTLALPPSYLSPIEDQELPAPFQAALYKALEEVIRARAAQQAVQGKPQITLESDCLAELKLAMDQANIPSVNSKTVAAWWPKQAHLLFPTIYAEGDSVKLDKLMNAYLLVLTKVLLDKAVSDADREKLLLKLNLLDLDRDPFAAKVVDAVISGPEPEACLPDEG